MLFYFIGDWDVHWGLTGLLTHGHLWAEPRGTRPAASKEAKPPKKVGGREFAS